MLTNSTSKYICWFHPWWVQDFVYFAFLHFFWFDSGCAWQPYYLHDLSRRDLCSPSCRIPVLHSHLHSCHYLSSPSSWQGVLCLSQQPTCCQQTHFTEKYIPKTCGCFQRLWEKISVLNKQNHEDQHPSASPSSQCTLVLSVSGNISGTPGLRYRQCITSYLP